VCVGTLLFCLLGAYSINSSVFDIWVMLGFGVIGFVLRKLDIPLAPAILGLILGPQLEKSLRTSLEMSAGDFSIFLTRPITVVLLVLSVAVILISALNLAPSQIREASDD
jgi:putative tricarboxylic transport membrane protein